MCWCFKCLLIAVFGDLTAAFINIYAPINGAIEDALLRRIMIVGLQVSYTYCRSGFQMYHNHAEPYPTSQHACRRLVPWDAQTIHMVLFKTHSIYVDSVSSKRCRVMLSVLLQLLLHFKVVLFITF